MDERTREADVAEPVVEREQLDRLARPAAQRVVADRQQQAEQDLRGEDADGDQAGN